jgi:hypothetical protein
MTCPGHLPGRLIRATPASLRASAILLRETPVEALL